MYNRNTYFCMQINILYTNSPYAIWYMWLQNKQWDFTPPLFKEKRMGFFVGRGVRMTEILPTLLLNCLTLLENMGFDFKYLLQEYIDKSRPTSPRGTAMLVAPAVLPGLWLEPSRMFRFQQLCWSHVWLPDEIATDSLAFSLARSSPN